METHERLYRSQTEKVIGGVAGGLADYFEIDVVLSRVVFVLLAFFGGGGVLIYIVLWIVIPSQPFPYSTYNSKRKARQTANDGPDDLQSETSLENNNKPVKHSNTGLFAGVILIMLGLLFLGDKIFPWYNIADLWPLILVVIGIFIIKPSIFKPTKKQSNEI